MEQYINKSALVAEIKGYISNYKEIVAKTNRNDSTWVDSVSMIDAKIDVLRHLLSFLNTIEVKEVDLDESARHYLLHEHISPLNEVLHQADLKVEMQYHKDIEDAYKAGFELGLKAKDVNEIIKTAEDHAYFAGSENTREKLIDKACEWLSQTDFCRYYNKEFIDVFRKAMEE